MQDVLNGNYKSSLYRKVFFRVPEIIVFSPCSLDRQLLNHVFQRQASGLAIKTLVKMSESSFGMLVLDALLQLLSLIWDRQAARCDCEAGGTCKPRAPASGLIPSSLSSETLPFLGCPCFIRDWGKVLCKYICKVPPEVLWRYHKTAR